MSRGHPGGHPGEPVRIGPVIDAQGDSGDGDGADMVEPVLIGGFIDAVQDGGDDD